MRDARWEMRCDAPGPWPVPLYDRHHAPPRHCQDRMAINPPAEPTVLDKEHRYWLVIRFASTTSKCTLVPLLAAGRFGGCGRRAGRIRWKPAPLKQVGTDPIRADPIRADPISRPALRARALRALAPNPHLPEPTDIDLHPRVHTRGTRGKRTPARSSLCRRSP